MKFFIIHGTYGYPDENWFPWLKVKLEEKGHKVFIPKFPTPENQNLQNWMKIFEKYIDEVDEETILIGHSLGSSFILSILENLNLRVKGIFLVAGFVGEVNKVKKIDVLNRTFTIRNFDWDKIKSNVKNIYIINSTNDPYINIEKGEELARNLNSNLIKIDDAGHINSEAGFDKFEFIFSIISNLE